MTEWRAVLGFEGRYEVSSEGRVRRLARVVAQRDGRKYPVREKTLKNLPHPGGYSQVCLRTEIGVNGRMRYVHRLVAEAFLSNPKKLPEVNHINLNKCDNRVANLEWVDARANAAHAKANGLYHGRTNASQRMKLTPQQADEIYVSVGSGLAVAEAYGVSETLVRLIRDGKRWLHPSEQRAWSG